MGKILYTFSTIQFIYNSNNYVTILDENLGACEAPMHSSHMQRDLPFFILWIE